MVGWSIKEANGLVRYGMKPGVEWGNCIIEESAKNDFLDSGVREQV